jgi:hypothetical protein
MLPVPDQAVLHEPAFQGAIENLQEGGAVIVIAKHQMNRKRKCLQALLQGPVAFGFAPFGEISRYGAKLRIPMILHDISKALVEAREGIKPPELLARRHQMKVSDMDEFHQVFFASFLKREPRSNPAASTIG